MVATLVPSKSNAAGTLAGLVSGIAISYLTSQGYLDHVAAATGLPADQLAILAGTIVTGIVGFAVTHVGEVAWLNDFIGSLPKVYAKPTDFPSTATKNNPFPPAPAAAAIGQELKQSDVVAVVNDKRNVSDFPQGKNGA